MNLTTLFGLAAGFMTTVAFLPQVIQTWRTKKTRDLALGTFLFQGISVLLWFSYGLMIKEVPLIVWNIITALLVFTIVFFKLKYR